MHKDLLRLGEESYTEVGEKLEYDRWFDVPVRTARGYIPTRELMERVLTGRYAEHMHGQDLRFWQAFAYDREVMRDQLGEDVEPVGHMQQTAVFAAKILESQINAGETIDIPPQLIGLTLLAIATHDIGESMHPEIKTELGFVIGDIQRGRKTDLDRERETAIRRFVWEKELPELTDDQYDFMEMVVAHKHEDYDDPSVRLGEAAHSIQALDTAMRARQSFYRKWDEYVNGEDFSNRAVETYRAPAALYEQVSKAIIPEMNEWGKEYAYIRQFKSEYRIPILLAENGRFLLSREEPMRDEAGELVAYKRPLVGRIAVALQATIPERFDRPMIKGANVIARWIHGRDLGLMPLTDQEDLTIYPLN